MRRTLVILLTLVMAGSFAPAATAAQPLTGTMDLQFNLGWPGYQEDIPDWVGTTTIDGLEYGMAFFLLGTGKSQDANPSGVVGFFEEKWVIYQSLEFAFDEDGFLVTFEPGDVLLSGHDRGVSNVVTNRYHMSGTVGEAAEPYAAWLDGNVHMRGVIVWYDSGPFAGWPQHAPGTLRIN